MMSMFQEEIHVYGYTIITVLSWVVEDLNDNVAMILPKPDCLDITNEQIWNNIRLNGMHGENTAATDFLEFTAGDLREYEVRPFAEDDCEEDNYMTLMKDYDEFAAAAIFWWIQTLYGGCWRIKVVNELYEDNVNVYVWYLFRILYWVRVNNIVGGCDDGNF
ncbi:hypothetical protein LXL04_000201 [Taraxacum kok-saghyz]